MLSQKRWHSFFFKTLSISVTVAPPSEFLSAHTEDRLLPWNSPGYTKAFRVYHTSRSIFKCWDRERVLKKWSL